MEALINRARMLLALCDENGSLAETSRQAAGLLQDMGADPADAFLAAEAARILLRDDGIVRER